MLSSAGFAVPVFVRRQEKACPLPEEAERKAGVRYDGGGGVEGAGIELGGGLEFSSGRLTAELHATWPAAHREDLEEWGSSVSAEPLAWTCRPAIRVHGCATPSRRPATT